MEITGKNILVVGLARSGVAAAEFLARLGARVTVNDAKAESELKDAPAIRAKGIEVVGGGHPRELFESSELIVVSPGVPLASEPFGRARAAGVPIISEVELAARFLRGRLVGITGSNGKTTTTTLIGELLKNAGLPTQVGGNIGTPLISLAETSSNDGVTVVELSSFQLEAVEQLHVNVALLLNITPDHLDRYDSMEAYAAAKANIFRNQTANDVAVLNADNDWSAKMNDRTNAAVIYFSRLRELEQGIFLRGDEIIERSATGERVLLTRADIPLPGDHNVENVMAALAAGLACGASPDSMRQTVRDFKGVEHRLEFVAEIKGVRFYNDSKATNVDAAIKCLEAFTGGVIVILGGKDKGSDYAPLAALVRERCEHVVLIGAAADKIAAALENTRPLHRAATMPEAVKLGLELGRPGDTVLLAPACASFDMFDNYEHRGRVFKEAVRSLVSGQ
ncbi:MAG TPA: UDP-N-acetylmuramoyl-L-alanine--D-glutamate ligase [Blastocatellia bacterium]|nr:UDP-N-acetylmuramoyl-L-alanine--D-glutamate ligase [Blastocatellia bacterium]HMV86522.1 UDP-N-acetylmuramoyl-L-alanine--D-glutamate ligase [Blastocatellia bacterium]HMX25844.1 UDP-N-acetylmuramoyl-L-alanine--D-glutamate ligase [Blastocatellia bacterium]HMY71661.1 UDP-N-acetylmuramoyl-L-alanine--D-glutamate ligase [Blastocatellia bacterium]HMZ20499.1 UDP-N-acetylmuramoyl-L-alanine--D-glutamate ligase [Blastocatellia bacterium]